MYDLIIVGTRVAGSATAMLMARRGLSVLAVDRAAFPSDTLSTHQVQVPGIALLERWGLLDELIAAGTPATQRVRFDPGHVVLEGSFPAYEGVDALFSPRRRLLDAVLVDAARAAGAEVRERFSVEELTFDDGRVTGIRGRDDGGRSVIERAPLVIGADGRHSLVARAVRPVAYREQPPLTFGYYTYWSGVPLEGGEIYGRGRRLVGAWPTNDDLVVTYVVGPIADFRAFRSDIEGNVLAALDQAGDLGARIRAGERVERLRGTADTPNRFRTPHGPGWALVGDSGLVLDPATGQGIGFALRDAQLLADAADAGFTTDALAGYERRRNDAASDMYDFTVGLASFAPPDPEGQRMLESLAGRQEAIDRFLGVLTGAVPFAEMFAPTPA